MTATFSPADVFPRIGSGNPEADTILGGGFPANSINIVMGQPGCGKTVFAEQLAFHNAGIDGDRPILYLTTLSEPLSKIVSHLQRFTFYDEMKLGSAVVYDDLGTALLEGGVQALIDRVRDAIQTSSPKIIVLDSFKVVHDLEAARDTMRQLVSNLAGLLSAYDVTTFLIGEYTEEHIATCPEFAVADGIVELARLKLSTRDERFFRVLKLRGSAYREGMHGLRISSDGVDVFPRLVSPELPEGYRIRYARTPSGVAGLDPLIDGGLWCGSTTLVAGPTGAGKTTIAVQFALEGGRIGERALYVNFQENPTQLHRLVQSLGTDMTAAQANGFQILYTSPVELQMDSIISTIYRRIGEAGIQRIVIDSVSELYGAAADKQRLQDYLYALTQHFTASGVTSLLTFETPSAELGSMPEASSRNLGFSYIADNILLLRPADADGARTLLVLKTRNSDHDARPHVLRLTDAGATVGVP